MSDAAARKTDVKKRIRELRAEIGEALGAKDASRAGKLRREVKRLKRETRHLSREAKTAPAPTEAAEAPAPEETPAAPASEEA